MPALLAATAIIVSVFAAAALSSLLSSSSFGVREEPRRSAGGGTTTTTAGGRGRRLSESRPPSSAGKGAATPSKDRRPSDVERVLSLATLSAEDAFTDSGEGEGGGGPLRVLFIVTTLSEYDKGTRGTTSGADRLMELVLPILVDGVSSMVDRGWHVDVYLICGFEALAESRRNMIVDALPRGVGLEVWTDAIPLYYVKRYNGKLKAPDGLQGIELASHGLSRQHRYVVRDKLMEYDIFAAFEDDMRVTADHVVNFLEMSVDIDRARREAENSLDGKARVMGAALDNRSVRGKSADGATVGNDVVEDPMTAEELGRLWPGFVRVEVLDTRGGGGGGEGGKGGRGFDDGGDGSVHPLLRDSALDNFRWKDNVPPSMKYESQFGTIDPGVCCGVPPGRARTPAHPKKDDLLLWETDISAMGVRHYPGDIGWAAAMTVEDRADVGSYWSGMGHNYDDPNMKRPRRVDSLLGQQAGWMATRSQVLYFHEHACPGGFMPPFDGKEWSYDSLQTKNGAVEFWSGGYQLFGRCYFNRILSMDPARFSRQLLYHASNNKQRTVSSGKFIRLTNFLGQLYTVKERALKSLMMG
ncbi:hypothetical protein ACHAW5_001526 [Stephanodiscus triporus]|uniref:Uncharacterized protein n=1 Tax=Stephanodiscus triporus TaxID=2934178 RepID=A0ABD3NXS6_9STRA